MNEPGPPGEHPHQGQPVVESGVPIQEARAAVVMVHGRGANAKDILSLVTHLGVRDVHYRAVQAAGNTWYPYSFLAPLQQNEPFLGSALQFLDEVVTGLSEEGAAVEKTVLLGFSQGACLALEYAVRHPRPFGGVVAFSGGLIGNGEQEGEPPDDKLFEYGGSLSGVHVFLGCSDVDPHIPVRRIDQTKEAFEHLGATVTKRIYSGMGHAVNEDELSFARGLLDGLADRG